LEPTTEIDFQKKRIFCNGEKWRDDQMSVKVFIEACTPTIPMTLLIGKWGIRMGLNGN